MTEPQPSDDHMFHVDFADGTTYDLDEIRRLKTAIMPDNQHAWVISTVFELADPDQSMDEMVLDATNFVGVGSITCLFCLVKYETGMRYHKCPQTTTEGP